MKVLFVLSVAVCSAFAPKCCPPDTWEGVMGTNGGYLESSGETGPISEEALVHHDRNRSIQVTVYNEGRVDEYRVIRDYIANEEYTVVNETSCTRSYLPGTFEDGYCVPAYARHNGVHVYGINGLYTNVYTYELSYGDVDIKQSVIVTSDDCVPLAAVYTETNPSKSQFRSIGFYNLTTEIKDPSVFDIPAMCLAAEAVSTMAASDTGPKLFDWVMRRPRH
ncbi:ependymin-related protein 1-like [Ptychodera flava]|uniref:ependymin-related protein 1-like n=1 Tax=Ptychodera flava TaxID=63121 RepID=UPI00396A396B